MSTLRYDDKMCKITGSDCPYWKSYYLYAHALAVDEKENKNNVEVS